MVGIFSLAACTLAAWLVHIVLAVVYMRFFASTKSIGFRALHMTEIALTVSVMAYLYTRFTDEPLSAGKALIVVLSTLIIVDTAALIINSDMRGKFDAWHFTAAYAVIAAVILIVFSATK